MKRTDMLRAAGLTGLLVILLVLFLKNPVPESKPAASTPISTSSSLSRTDPNGVTWTVDQAGGGQLLSAEPNAPKAGPPITVKTDVQKVADREVSIGLILEGQAGEQYRPAVKRNGATLAAPRLRVVNEAGQVITQGDFQYG